MPLLDKAPKSFDDYASGGGGRGLEIALGAGPEAVIDEVAKSGLRGRGGAGFPTGEKWRSIRSTGTGTRFAVCNGAEGEPATFKDRTLFRTNPYQVLEGLAIAAYAVGAERAYVGLKEAFAEEVQAVDRALREMREADALDPIAIELVLGPDLYLFGEETGLEEVIEGRPPRIARPFMFGLFAAPPNDNPTLVNNVETLANIPHILAEGPDWLRSSGTETSPGMMLFPLSMRMTWDDALSANACANGSQSGLSGWRRPRFLRSGRPGCEESPGGRRGTPSPTQPSETAILSR